MATDDSNPVDPFDSNTPQYRAYFPEGSRDDVEFRLTRMLSRFVALSPQAVAPSSRGPRAVAP